MSETNRTILSPGVITIIALCREMLRHGSAQCTSAMRSRGQPNRIYHMADIPSLIANDSTKTKLPAQSPRHIHARDLLRKYTTALHELYANQPCAPPPEEDCDVIACIHLQLPSPTSPVIHANHAPNPSPGVFFEPSNLHSQSFSALGTICFVKASRPRAFAIHCLQLAGCIGALRLNTHMKATRTSSRPASLRDIVET